MSKSAYPTPGIHCPNLKTIEWQLGGPGSDYSFPNPDDQFYVHATELSNGNILLFDNSPRSEGGNGYSRALEIRLDEESRSAVKAWEYRHEPDTLSQIVSSATRFDNGNTLITFGTRTNPELEPLTVVEVDGQGRELFRAETLLVSGDMGEPVVRSTFNIYRTGRMLTYFKRSCGADDTRTKFLLHVVPVDEGNLVPDTQTRFQNLDFHFAWSGDFVNGGCVAERLLPDYPISHIRTGQFCRRRSAAVAGGALIASRFSVSTRASSSNHMVLRQHAGQGGAISTRHVSPLVWPVRTSASG